MSDEHSIATEEEGKITPQEIELTSIPDDDTRALAKRYGEQERGKMFESVRHTLVAFMRDPAEGLKEVEKLDPKVAQRVLKDLGVKSVDELRKTDTLSEEKVAAIVANQLKEASSREVENTIVNKLAQLPEIFREVAQKEYNDLTNGRTLSGEERQKYFEKAVTLARHETGSYEKTAKLTWGSQGISSVSNPPDIGGERIEAEHPFFRSNTK